MQFDCEIEGCGNKTENFLCTFHETETKNENMQIIICNNCNKILKAERRKPAEARYKFVKDCMRCNSQKIDRGIL